jgi:hypothetical protein
VTDHEESLLAITHPVERHPVWPKPGWRGGERRIDAERIRHEIDLQHGAFDCLALNETSTIERREIRNTPVAIDLDIFGARIQGESRACPRRSGLEIPELAAEGHKLESEQPDNDEERCNDDQSSLLPGFHDEDCTA